MHAKTIRWNRRSSILVTPVRICLELFTSGSSDWMSYLGDWREITNFSRVIHCHRPCDLLVGRLWWSVSNVLVSALSRGYDQREDDLLLAQVLVPIKYPSTMYLLLEPNETNQFSIFEQNARINIVSIIAVPFNDDEFVVLYLPNQATSEREGSRFQLSSQVNNRSRTRRFFRCNELSSIRMQSRSRCIYVFRTSIDVSNELIEQK